MQRNRERKKRDNAHQRSNGCAKSRRKEMTDLRGVFCPRAFSMSTSRHVRVSLLSAGVREGVILRLPIFARRSGKNSPDSPLSYPPERRVFPCGVLVRDGADDAKDKQRSPKPCTNLCPQGRFHNPPIACLAFTGRFISTWWIWVGLANTTPAVGSRWARISEALRKPPNEPSKDKTVLRQAQHERQIFNNFNTHPFALSVSKGERRKSRTRVE